MLSVSPVLIVITVVVSVVSEVSVRSVIDVERGGGVRRALESDGGGVLEGGGPHGAGRRDDVVEVLPHVPRVDGAAPPREYARPPPPPRIAAGVGGGGGGNVCHALKERSDFLIPAAFLGMSALFLEPIDIWEVEGRFQNRSG